MERTDAFLDSLASREIGFGLEDSERGRKISFPGVCPEH